MSDHDILSDAERAALTAVMQVPDLPPLRALVVDGDRATCDELAKILGVGGIACLTANDAMTALDLLLRNKSIGLLITDLRTTPFNGLELSRKIRESERDSLPIIIISGDAEVCDAIAAMHLSVVDFLLRPIDENHLLSLARRELGLGS